MKYIRNWWHLSYLAVVQWLSCGLALGEALLFRLAIPSSSLSWRNLWISSKLSNIMIIVYFGKHGKPGWSSDLKALALDQGRGSNAGEGFIFIHYFAAFNGMIITMGPWSGVGETFFALFYLSVFFIHCWGVVQLWTGVGGYTIHDKQVLISFHINDTFYSTLDSTFLWVVVQDWYNTIFLIKDPDPYPLTNGGQTVAR